MSTSAIFIHAAATWNEMKDEYDSAVEFSYMAAEKETNGFLLNKAGRAAGIDPASLFTGHAGRARKYASEELIAYWEKHPRMTLQEFENQWIQKEWFYNA